MKKLNVLSLFDGIAGCRLALERAGVPVNLYFASEIDDYAIQVVKKNWGSSVIQVGDVTSLRPGKFDGVTIDLITAGSPCQGFSNAGTLKNFDDERSKLLWEFHRLREALKPAAWMVENVTMRQEWQDEISKILGVNPVKINSADFSAQHRERLYWTNIPIYPHKKFPIYPHKKFDTKLADILLHDWNKIVDLFLSEREIDYMNRATKGGRTHWDFAHHSEWTMDKSRCVVANWKRGVPYNVLVDQAGIRKFHPIEVERLQTFPDNYTEGLSKTRRYQVLGNSWTVDVVAHIFKFFAVANQSNWWQKHSRS